MLTHETLGFSCITVCPASGGASEGFACCSRCRPACSRALENHAPLELCHGPEEGQEETT